MQSDSAILTLCAYLYTKFGHYYNESITGKTIHNLGLWIQSIWHGSWFYKVLYRPVNQKKFDHSRIFLFVQGAMNFLAAKLNALGPIIEKSAVVQSVNQMFEDILYVPLRTLVYLILPSILGIGIKIIQVYALGVGVSIAYAVGITLLALVLIPMKQPLSNLLSESGVVWLIGGFFHWHPVKGDARKTPAMLYVLSVLFVVLLFLPLYPIYYIVLIGGIFGLLLVLWRAEAGVFATVFLIALLPSRFILALCFLTVFSYFMKVFITGSRKILISPMDFMVLLFGLLLLVAGLASYDRRSSLIVAFTYLLFILFYFVVKNILDTKEKLFAALSIFIASAFCVASLGIIQKHTGIFVTTDSWVDSEMFEDLIGRVYATLDNPNVLGEFFIFTLPIAFAMVYYRKEWIFKLASFFILGVTALCLVYTLSRGAWIGTLMAFALFAVLYDRRLVILGIFGLLLSPLVIPTSILGRFTSIGDVSDSSTSYRVSIWLGSINLLKDYWLMGIGLGSDVFLLIYQKYAFSASYALHSHNFYLQVMIDLGIFGIIVLFGILFLFYKNALVGQSQTADKALKAISASLCAGMLGFLVHGVADNTWYNYRLVLVFWLILGFSECCSRLMQGEAS